MPSMTDDGLAQQTMAQVAQPYLLLVLLLLACTGQVLAQAEEGIPSTTYRSPVNHAIKVSGTFGELRSDHFHMGLDIKSAHGVAGDELFAVADGYVARLSVSSRGYGNALYLNHPNGTQSVYAHLLSFPEAIQDYLDSVHYARERFELDLDGLSPKRFPVKQGDVVGRMGNTGSSRGVHLHFELRVDDGDVGVNPLLHDFPVRDTRAPELRSLSVYHQNAQGQVQRIRSLRPSGSAPRYLLSDTVRVPAGKLALGLKAYDRQEGTRNLNGVYTLSARLDGSPLWSSTYDTIPYADSRYIQAHYDYRAKHEGDGYYYRLHRLPFDRLGLYTLPAEEGYFNLRFGESRTVDLAASDPLGNTSTLQLTLLADRETVEDPSEPYTHQLVAGKPDTVFMGEAELQLHHRSLYEDLFTTLRADTTPPQALGRCYRLGDKASPIHHALRFRIPLKEIPVALRSKVYLSSCEDGEVRLSGKLSTGSTHLEVRLDEWGDYALRVDTTAPSVRKLDRYTYLIEDDVSGTSRLHYRVSQDGKWVLAGLDAKRNRLSVRRDKVGQGPIRVEVWDEAGNKTQR